jgi:hypothetical protein
MSMPAKSGRRRALSARDRFVVGFLAGIIAVGWVVAREIQVDRSEVQALRTDRDGCAIISIS